MTRRVYIHVGPFKTGSTYLQQSMFERRDMLRERGIIVPSARGADRRLVVVDLLDRNRQRHAALGAPGALDRTVAEIAAWTGEGAVISAEMLSSARPDTVQRIVTAVAPAEVHVVATLRSLAGLIPSFWQSNLRNRTSVTWPAYIESLRGAASSDRRFGERFWRVQDVSAVLGVWAELIPPERTHVVVMPPTGSPPSLLWERFCAALGIDDPPPPAIEQARNVAVGTEQAEALRRLNRELNGKYPHRLYATFVKRIATRATIRATTDSRRMVLPPEDFEWVREQSRRIVDVIVAQGYRVHGDLADAVPDAPSVLGQDGPYRPDDYRLEEVADTLARMTVMLLEHMRKNDGRGLPASDDEDDATADDEFLTESAATEASGEQSAPEPPTSGSEAAARRERRRRRHERRRGQPRDSSS